MNQFISKCALVLSITTLGSVGVLAQQKPNYKVAISVTAKDDSVRNLAESYLTRELRSLQDVTITDSSPVFKIDVMIFANKLRTSGTIVGYTMSVVTSRVAICITLENVLKPKKEDTSYYDCYTSTDHAMQTGGSDDLKSMCEEIIAQFDTENLKPLRHTRNE